MPPREIPKYKKIEIFNEFQPLRIKYKDVFDFKEFYTALYEWTTEQEWKDPDGPGAFFERYYGEKVDKGDVKFYNIFWRLYKEAPETKAFAYYLDIDFKVIALMGTEIIKDGKKIKTNKGEVELLIRAFIEEKYKDMINKDKIFTQFKDLFSKRIYHKEIEIRKKEIYREAYNLHNFIKQWLKLKRYMPYEETKGFYPSASYPSHQK